MPTSPMARQTIDSQSIPTRNILINDPSELPSHYSSTPGGTLYSTTPGGTKLVYERSFLMNLRNSPISKTPPTYDIPGSIQKGMKLSSTSPRRSTTTNNNHIHNNNNKNQQMKNHYNKKIDDGTEDQFQMDL